MKSVNRNHLIDTIKGIACIGVVLIHYNWSNDISIIIKTISRFAVPFFFFVSGYYLPNSSKVITSDNFKRKIKHIFDLAVKSALVYAIFCIYWNSIMNSQWNLWTYTKSIFQPAGIVKFLLSSDPFVYAHFWYIIALLACYLILYLVRDKIKPVGYLIGFLVLIVCYSLFAEFNFLTGWKNYVPLTESATLVVSNMFIFRAMPFLLWGVYLKKSTIAEWKQKPNLLLLLAIAVLGCVLVVFEERHFGTILMYVGTHITVLALSLASVWYPDKKIGILEYIGDKLSMYVYIYHIAVGKMWDLIAAKFRLWGNPTINIIRPLLILAGSLLFAQILVSFQKWSRESKKVSLQDKGVRK